MNEITMPVGMEVVREGGVTRVLLPRWMRMKTHHVLMMVRGVVLVILAGGILMWGRVEWVERWIVYFHIGEEDLIAIGRGVHTGSVALLCIGLARMVFDAVVLLMPMRRVIEITGDQVKYQTQLGGMRRESSRRLKDVRQLRMVLGQEDKRSPIYLRMKPVIAVRTGADQTMYVGGGYPVVTLSALMKVMQAEIEERQGALEDRGEGRSGVSLKLPVRVAQKLMVEADEADSVTRSDDQPLMSEVVCERTSDELVLRIPRKGFNGVALNVFACGTTAVGVSILLGGVGLWSAISQRRALFLIEPLAMGCIGLLGLAPTLYGLQLARRVAVITARRDVLVFEWRGPLRKTRYEWKVEDLKEICVKESELTLNGRRPLEVWICGKTGKKRRFFLGRDDAELKWTARRLHRFYWGEKAGV